MTQEEDRGRGLGTVGSRSGGRGEAESSGGGQELLELRASEKRLRGILSSMDDLVFAFDPQGRFSFYHAPDSGMLLIPPEEFVGRRLSDVMPAGVHEPFARALESNRDGETTSFEYALDVGRGPEWFSARMSPVVDEGAYLGSVAVVRDITGHKRTEDALRASEEKYRTLADNVPVAVYRSAPGQDGKLLSANPAMVRMFRAGSLGTLGATPVTALYRDAQARERLMGKLRDLGSTENFIVELKRFDGTTFWATVSARGVRGADGDIRFVDGIITDITEMKHASDGLRDGLEKLRSTVEDTIKAMATMVEMKDPYTSGHQRRVADLACAIATELGLSETRIEGLRLAGLIHDLGKIYVPAEILSRPGPVSEIEMALIRTHPGAGSEILRSIHFDQPIAEIVLQHHERIDGSGYPNGLVGDAILFEARILAVADHVEAMASHRPYRPARGIDAALDELLRQRGVMFDVEAVDACLRLFGEKGFGLSPWQGSAESYH